MLLAIAGSLVPDHICKKKAIINYLIGEKNPVKSDQFFSGDQFFTRPIILPD